MRQIARSFCIDGEKFDSEAEFLRFTLLKKKEADGEITELTRQVEFVLSPKNTGRYRNERALVYKADFTYYENGRYVVEDVKPRNKKGDIPKAYKTTPAWRIYVIKRKLMLDKYGISIKET